MDTCYPDARSRLRLPSPPIGIGARESEGGAVAARTSAARSKNGARKEFVRAFISGITVRPDEARLDLVVNKLPGPNSNLSVRVVAGARYVPLQIAMRPMERFVAGLRKVA
jgi:hypothetical protein